MAAPSPDHPFKMLVSDNSCNCSKGQETRQPFRPGPDAELQGSTVCIDDIPGAREPAIEVSKKNCETRRALHKDYLGTFPEKDLKSLKCLKSIPERRRQSTLLTDGTNEMQRLDA